MRAIISFAVVSSFALTALAVPLQLSHQGRLLDSSDVPLQGNLQVQFQLWNADTLGNELWSDALVVNFNNGYYAVILGGTSNPIDENVLDNAEVWMSLTIGGEELLPRQRVVSAPYAVMAGTAENAGTVGGLTVAEIESATITSIESNPVNLATGTTVGGQTVATGTSIDGLTCNVGDVPILTAGGWDCVALPDFAGWDTDASDDLVTSTAFGGDVSGTYDALSIADGAVSEAKLDFDTATQTELDAVAATIPAQITSVNGLSGGTITSDVAVSGSISGGSISTQVLQNPADQASTSFTDDDGETIMRITENGANGLVELLDDSSLDVAGDLTVQGTMYGAVSVYTMIANVSAGGACVQCNAGDVILSCMSSDLDGCITNPCDADPRIDVSNRRCCAGGNDSIGWDIAIVCLDTVP